MALVVVSCDWLSWDEIMWSGMGWVGVVRVGLGWVELDRFDWIGGNGVGLVVFVSINLFVFGLVGFFPGGF